MNKEHPKVTAIRKVAALTRKLKTPENIRRNARNHYRRKKGVPEDAPLGTRADPCNKTRRGTGNVRGYISMPPAAWALLDRLKGHLSRGEKVAACMTFQEKYDDYLNGLDI